MGNRRTLESRIDLLLLTALTEEAQVVAAVLESVCTRAGLKGRVSLYDYSAGGEEVLRVATASAHDLGAVGMGVFAAPLLRDLRPSATALIGIAAAVDASEVGLGDVPFSSHVLSYDDIAVHDGVLTFRSQGFQVDPAMKAAVGELRTSAHTYEPWQSSCRNVIQPVIEAVNPLRKTKIVPQEIADPPHLVVEVTAGGPFLLRDKDFRDALRKRVQLPDHSAIEVASPIHPKLVSAEMESHGFMRAAHENGIPAVVLKGISDDGDAAKAELERSSGGFFRTYACSNAVLAVLHVLRLRASVESGATRGVASTAAAPFSADSEPDASGAVVSTPVAGWHLVDEALLNAHSNELDAAELGLYYDGREPDWRHAQAAESEIPRREVVALSVKAITEASDQTAVMLLGAGGEGKSTVVRQIAVDLVRSGHRVLFRDRNADPQLDASLVSGLSSEESWVLVSDEADEIAPSLEACVAALKDGGRTNVHWVLAARDNDWKARWRKGRRNLEPAWSQWATVWPSPARRGAELGLSPSDAEKIVGAWLAASSLGQLGTVSAGSRAKELHAASRGNIGLSDGTLFGAVLEKRFGAEGLKAHVANMLRRLGDDDHGVGSGHTLLHAFLYAAACDAIGIDGIDLNVVADLLGVPRERRRVDIRDALGMEAAGTGGGSALRTRHPAIAQVALQLVEAGDIREDLEEIYLDVVRGTASTARDLFVSPHGEVMNSGPTVLGGLQSFGLSAERAKEIGLAVADEAQRAEPQLLVLAVTRANTYREAGEPDAATEILGEALAGAADKSDWKRVGRGMLTELGACHGKAGRIDDNIALLGLSISDQVNAGAVGLRNASAAIGAIGGKLLEIAEGRDLPQYAGLALRVCERLYPHSIRRRNHHWAKAYGRLAKKLGTKPLSRDEALESLPSVVVQAIAAAEDRLLRDYAQSVLRGAAPSLELLARTLRGR